MRIGIITWFTGSNYGTNLQAIALQYFLRKKGYYVEIINCEVFVENKNNKRSFIDRLLGQPSKYINKYAYNKFSVSIKERDKKLAKSIESNCVLSARINSEEEFIDKCNKYDIIICGGDQIWNPNWYHRFYYADYNAILTPKMSYGPSIGVDRIPEEQKGEITRSLKSFNVISVREENSVKVIRELTNVPVRTVVDPAFLLSSYEWENIFPRKKDEDEKYVLSMFLTDNVSHWRAAELFAKKNKLKHITIPYCGLSYLQRGDVREQVGLSELLDLIRGAEFILTDSFHITVFSIIHRKQFLVFQRFKEKQFTSTNERIKNLLNLLRCNDRYVKYGTNRININSDINYEDVFDKLESEIIDSKQYLLEAVEKYSRK